MVIVNLSLSIGLVNLHLNCCLMLMNLYPCGLLILLNSTSVLHNFGFVTDLLSVAAFTGNSIKLVSTYTSELLSCHLKNLQEVDEPILRNPSNWVASSCWLLTQFDSFNGQQQIICFIFEFSVGLRDLMLCLNYLLLIEELDFYLLLIIVFVSSFSEV